MYFAFVFFFFFFFFKRKIKGERRKFSTKISISWGKWENLPDLMTLLINIQWFTFFKCYFFQLKWNAKQNKNLFKFFVLFGISFQLEKITLEECKSLDIYQQCHYQIGQVFSFSPRYRNFCWKFAPFSFYFPFEKKEKEKKYECKVHLMVCGVCIIVDFCTHNFPHFILH